MRITTFLYKATLASFSFIIFSFCCPSSSALASLPNNLKEKLLLDAQRRGKLEDLHKSVQEISAEAALRLFHGSTLQDNRQPEESKLQTTTKDLLLLLHECPDVHVSEELKQVP